MLYSLKNETGHERTKGKSTSKKNKLWDNTHPLPPHPHSNMNQAPPPPPPNLCHPPIIHNNNRMDTEFLVQMRQSNKRQCKEWWNIELTLRIWWEPFSQHPLPPARHQPHSFLPPKQLIRKNQRTQKWDSTLNKSYRTALAYVHRTHG